MKLNLTQVFKTLGGKDIVSKETGPLILKAALLDTLLGQVAGDEVPEASKYKQQRFELAKKISGAKNEVELDLEELNAIKKAIEGRVPAWLPLMHGQALAMIEGKATGLEE